MILVFCQFISLFACAVIGTSYFKPLETKHHKDATDIPEMATSHRLCIVDFISEAPEAVTAVQQLISEVSPTMMLIKNIVPHFAANSISGYEYFRFFPEASGPHAIISNYNFLHAKTGSVMDDDADIPVEDKASCELAVQLDTARFDFSSAPMRSEAAYLDILDPEIIAASDFAHSIMLLDFVGEPNCAVADETSRKVYVSPTCTAESVHVFGLSDLTVAIIDFDAWKGPMR